MALHGRHSRAQVIVGGKETIGKWTETIKILQLCKEEGDEEKLARPFSSAAMDKFEYCNLYPEEVGNFPRCQLRLAWATWEGSGKKDSSGRARLLVSPLLHLGRRSTTQAHLGKLQPNSPPLRPPTGPGVHVGQRRR